ncbi:MAG: peptidoglycan-binding domain-containing protein [Pyrinomonadaceae bacterium]
MIRKIVLVLSISLLFAAVVCAQETSTSSTKASTDSSTKKAPIFRPTKDQIEQVQTILKEKSLYDGDASGKYNDPTRAGIKSFQKVNGLKETGTLNRATLEKFGVELTDNQKQIPVSPNSYATTGDAKSSKAKTSSSKMSTDGTAVEKPKRAAPFRANSDQIKAAQKTLKGRSMYSGDETGKLDDATREGLRKFQESVGMKVTGTLNAATLDKMGIPLTDKQKADAAAAPKN